MKLNLRTTSLAIIAAAGVCSGVLSTPAHAVLINGQLSISGSDDWNSAGKTITFDGSDVNSGTGSFAPFVSQTPVTMRNVGAPVSYALQNLTGGSNLNCGTGGVIAGCLYQTTIGGLTAGFEIDSYSVNEIPGSLTITGVGFAYLTGFEKTPGNIILTTQDPSGHGTNLSFSATSVAVPGPVVGAGLPGLLAACAGLIGFARRRRRLKLA